MVELPSKLPEIVPTSEAPFAEDKLNRSKFAGTLRSIVDTYATDSCVLSINGEWGTGKTTFVKMWQKYMERLGYRTIYFNAWETDYISDPLIALLGELQDIIPTDDNFDKVYNALSRIALNAGSAVISALLKKVTGISGEAIQGLVVETKDILKESIKEYATQKSSLSDFKKVLCEYVANVSESQKATVIFIVDELDRCNPHYAVKLLERIKHLFDIPNIFFVLPICKSQLECSIQGFYGSDRIDAKNYLRRFITLEFELPKPDNEDFYNYLFDYYKFYEFFDGSISNKRSDNIEIFISSVRRIFHRTNIDLRTMDKLFVHCRLVAQEIRGNLVNEMDVIFLLCYLKQLHFEVYDKIRRHTYTLQELINTIENLFPNTLLDSKLCDNMDFHGFTYTIAGLLIIYNQKNVMLYEEGVLPQTTDSKMTLTCKVLDKEKLKEALINSRLGHPMGYSTIKDLTEKIDLLQQLK